MKLFCWAARGYVRINPARIALTPALSNMFFGCRCLGRVQCALRSFSPPCQKASGIHDPKITLALLNYFGTNNLVRGDHPNS